MITGVPKLGILIPCLFRSGFESRSGLPYCRTTYRDSAAVSLGFVCHRICCAGFVWCTTSWQWVVKSKLHSQQA